MPRSDNIPTVIMGVKSECHWQICVPSEQLHYVDEMTWNNQIIWGYH